MWDQPRASCHLTDNFVVVNTPAQERADAEMFVLRYLEGYENREIAEMLFISKKTVERHRANILEKLGMRDRVELTRYAIRRGLVQP